MRKTNENKLQAECFKWANNTYCLKHHKPRLTIFSVPNGGTRNKLEAMTLKSTGLRSGVSDLIALFPNGKCVFFELKFGKGFQSDEQIDFEKIVKDLGFEYYLIYTFEDFKNIFKKLCTHS
jgi:hypothetical protein